MKMIIPFLALASLATAQATLVTTAAVGVHANRQVDAVRAGTDASRGLSLSATDPRIATASSHVGLTREGNGAAFKWEGIAAPGNTSGTIGGSPVAAGAQKYGMGLVARTAMRGTLVAEYTGHGSVGASVTAGGKTMAFRGGSRGERQAITGLSVGTTLLRVSISITGKADSSTSRTAVNYAGTLRVTFVPTTQSGCSVTGHARSCSKGGALAGHVTAGSTSSTLDLALQGALPSAIGVTLVSGSERMFQIGTTGCTFFAMPIVANTFTTDAQGGARSRLRFPMRTGGIFFVQQATIVINPRGFDLATSNSLKVSCR